jgi:Macrocin-O-methyltransferase (TylF)
MVSMIFSVVRRALRSVGVDIRRVSQTPFPEIEHRARRAAYLKRMIDRCPSGDIVECGVGYGDSILLLAIFSESQARNVWGFDSFEGFPEPSPEDASARKPQKGEWKSSKPSIESMLQGLGLSDKYVDAHVRLIPGFFSDSLSQYDGSSIAFLHLDCDLYQSYMDCLNVLYKKVCRGGIIAFDEYGERKWPGATKAIDEFFRGKEPLVRDFVTGKYHVVKS